MMYPRSLILLITVNLVFSLPSKRLHPAETAALMKRQISATSMPAVCNFVCSDFSNAIQTCTDTACLCNNKVLNSFLTCTECTIANSGPSNLNATIASSQLTIDAYRSTCSLGTPAVSLPNVTVTAPPANATYPTGSNSSSVFHSASASVTTSRSSSLLSSASATAVASSNPSSASAVETASAPVGSGSTTPISDAEMRFRTFSWVTAVVICLALRVVGI